MHERMKEHNRDIRLARTQASLVSEHANKTDHFHYSFQRLYNFLDRDPHVRLQRPYTQNINRDSGIKIPEAWMPTIKKNSSDQYQIGPVREQHQFEIMRSEIRQ